MAVVKDIPPMALGPGTLYALRVVVMKLNEQRPDLEVTVAGFVRWAVREGIERILSGLLQPSLIPLDVPDFRLIPRGGKHWTPKNELPDVDWPVMWRGDLPIFPNPSKGTINPELLPPGVEPVRSVFPELFPRARKTRLARERSGQKSGPIMVYQTDQRERPLSDKAVPVTSLVHQPVKRAPKAPRTSKTGRQRKRAT